MTMSTSTTMTSEYSHILLDKPGIRVRKDDLGSFYEVVATFDTRPVPAHESATDTDSVLVVLSSHAFLETLFKHVLTHFVEICEREVDTQQSQKSSMFVLFAPFFRDLGVCQKFMSVDLHQMIIRECDAKGNNITQVYQFVERSTLPEKYATQAAEEDWEQSAFQSIQVWFQRLPVSESASPGIQVTMKVHVPDMDTDEVMLLEKLTCLLLHKGHKKINEYIQSL